MTKVTIQAYGPALIAQQAQTVIDQNSTNAEEQDQPVSNATETVMERVLEDSFLKTMLYAYHICQEYEGIASEFESDQREKRFRDCQDWRRGILAGLRRITESAILAEATRILTDSGSNTSQRLDRTVEYTYTPEEVKTDAKQISRRKSEYSLKPGMEPMEVTNTKLYETALGDKADFIYKLLIMDELAENYDLETWVGMTDSAVREGISCNGFIEGVEETLPEEIVDNVDETQSLRKEA